MSITYTPKFLTELKNPNRTPDKFIEIDLDMSTTVRWGQNKRFPDIRPVVKSISKLHNKLDVKKNLATKGSLTFQVVSSSYIDSIIQGYRLKNLRIRKYEGFIADGWDDTDYIKTYEGLIYDLTRSGEIYTFKARDVREQTQKVVPTAKTDKTQYVDYSDTNNIDIMTDLIGTQAGIAAGDYDGTKFNSERDTWYNGWVFHRIITKTQPIEKYLEQLQLESGGYIFHAGDKISFKAFAPIVPGSTIRDFSDDFNLLQASISNESGYVDQFANRIEVYFDYTESGNDRKDEDYESVVIEEDTDSQSEWGEIKTRIIKAQWIRSFKFDNTVNIAGTKIYAMSKDNGAGAGTLSFNFTNQTLTWQALGDTVGAAVNVNSSGKYQIKSNDEKKYIRIIVDATLTPGSNKADTITMTAIAGETYAATIAGRLLNRLSSPLATIKGSVDYHDISNNGVMYNPTDIVNITTDKVVTFGQPNFDGEQCILLEVRADERTQRIKFEAQPTRLSRKGMFIAPTGQPDYAAASDAEREYMYIGRTSDNKVFDGVNYVDGSYII